MKERVGVVGAGLMGAEIALVFALAGHEVLLNDRDEASITRGIDRLKTLMQKGTAKGLYKEEDIAPTIARIKPTVDLAAFSAVDFVTEAVFEDQAVKAAVLDTLNKVCKPTCLIATNTSTIQISTLAGLLPKERRPYFIGTHYFSPVSRMKLVEVMPAFETSEDTITKVTALCTGVGKAPIRVKDVAGFAVNRMLHAFVIEAIRLVEEGVATPEDLDKACRLGLGHAMGPFELMDVVTLSLCVQAHGIMEEAYGERFRSPPLLKQMVRAGYVGGKGKPGWYTK